MFDEKTIQNLKSYVYLLIDPTTDEPFYVGKGNGNRVFDHVNCALNEETINDKYDHIRKIHREENEVRHLIVRHGLTDAVAFEIESALIDTFTYIPRFKDFVLGNVQGGIKSIEKGIMTADEVKRLYNAEQIDDIQDGSIIININTSYKRGAGVDAIYQATKQTWQIAKNKWPTIKYVLSEYRGLIVEVFKVNEFYANKRGYNPGAKKYGQTYMGFGFNGDVADEAIRSRYINKSVTDIKVKGYAAVVIFPETFRKIKKRVNAQS